MIRKSISDFSVAEVFNLRKRTSFKIIQSISGFIILSTIYLSSCKKESPVLPPASRNNETASKIFSRYENWNFGEKAFQHTEAILSFGPRPIESDGHKNTQNYIQTELEKQGWVVKAQRFETQTPYGKRTFTNHIARFAGPIDNKKDGIPVMTQSPSMVIAAHYDSKLLEGFLGADDAASCVGALLEIAEELPKQDLDLCRKIELVFFDGEEALNKNIVAGKDGLYGSYYYSNFLVNDLAGSKARYQQPPRFGVVLDMIGHKNLRIKIPADTPFSLLNHYMDIAAKHGLENQFSVARGAILDDHYFMNEIAKIPTIDLIGDFSASNWWHTKNDSLSNISVKSLSTSIQFALELINDQLSSMNKQ